MAEKLRMIPEKGWTSAVRQTGRRDKNVTPPRLHLEKTFVNDGCLDIDKLVSLFYNKNSLGI